MSLAAETRAAVRARPFLLAALRTGVVNFAAAARHIDVAEDTDAVATALRRYAADLPGWETRDRRVRVTMHGGLSDDPAEPLLSVDDAGIGDGDGDGGLTGVLAAGDVDARSLAQVLGVLDANGVDAEAAGVAGGSLVVVVARRDGPATVQHVEDALSAVPTKATV